MSDLDAINLDAPDLDAPNVEETATGPKAVSETAVPVMAMPHSLTSEADHSAEDGQRWVRYRWRYHVSVLSVSAVVLAAALVMTVDGRQSVKVPVIGRLPGVCTWKRAFSMDCPGCGLTRCFVSIAHGNVDQAWNFNPVGILMFAILIYQFPFRGFQLWRLANGRQDFRHSVWAVNIVVWGVVLGLVLQWLWRHVL